MSKILLKLSILLLLFLRLPGVSVAQIYSFSHYQVESGLSNNAVTCSIIDKKGFLWFGTKDGLNRYDGLNFKSYLHNPADSNTIGNDFINCLAQDSRGNLLVGTDRGLYALDQSTEVFRKIQAGSDRPIRAVLSDAYGYVWYIAGSELLRRSPSGATLFFGQQFFASALCRQGGQLWVGLSQGLVQKFDYKTNRFILYQDRSVNKPALDYWVQCLFSDEPGKIYIGTSSRGVRLLNTNTGRYTNIPLKDQTQKGLFVRDFVRRRGTEIWIATEEGIFAYNESNGHYTQLVNKLNEPYSLSDNAVYTFLKDRQDGIWAGTYYGGINYSAALNTPFEKFAPNGRQGAISGRTVREICRDNAGNLWIGTEDAGLNMLDPRTGRFSNFPGTADGKGISNANIHGLLIDDNKLWIGTFEHGLDVMDLRTKKVFRRYRAGFGPNELKSNFIYCIFKTTNGTKLIGTPEGLYRYNEKTDNFYQLTEVPTHAFYTTITQDRLGNLWAGTFRDGVFIFSSKNIGIGKGGSFVRIKGLETERITSILESRDAQMWITTESGLYRCNRYGEIEKHYTGDDGLPTELLYNCLEDEQGQLWISSSSGLIVFNLVKGTFVTYRKTNGLLTEQFNYNSAFKDPSGKMYFGTVQGLIAFEPSKFKKSTVVPPVYITGFQVRNQELVPGANSPLKKSIISTAEIELPYYSATFSIDFSALSYPSPDAILFEYRLGGLESQWTVLRKNRRVYFTQVPPGKYTFMVRALSQDRSWVTRSTQLTIHIVPPFWKHPIAYVLYAAFVIVAAYMLFARYKRNLQNQHQRQLEAFENKKQQEIYEAKIEFFTNIAHEIRTPLTLIRVPMERLIEHAGDMPSLEKSIRTMDRNTNRLLALANQLLDFRSTEKEAFSLNFVKANIHDLLTDIWTDFQAAAENKKLAYQLILPEEKLRAFVDVEAFTKIVSNLLDNAIKFAEGKVFLQLIMPDETGQQFTVKVGSDSSPLPAELQEQIFEPFFVGTHHAMKKKGTGLGLALARALAELHNGILKVDEPSGGCNVFSLTLPLHQQFEFELNGKWRKK